MCNLCIDNTNNIHNAYIDTNLQPKCINSKCSNLTKYSNRYKKYQTYCSKECRKQHEENTWQEFVNNAPKCKTPGYLESNKLKEAATLNNGYNFEFMIL